MPKFISTELESELDDTELEPKSELEAESE